MVAYLVKMRPFKSELQQVIVVSDEFVLIFGVALLGALYFNQYEADPAYKICICIIGVVVLSFVKNLSVIILLAVRDTYRKFRTWVHKKVGTHEKKRLRLKREREQEREREQRKLEEEKLDQLSVSHAEVSTLNASFFPPSGSPVIQTDNLAKPEISISSPDMKFNQRLDMTKAK